MKSQKGKAILTWAALCFGAALACLGPNPADGQVVVPPATPLRLVTLAEALKDYGIDTAPPSLIAALKNSDPYVRSLAAHKLAEDRVLEAIPLIESALAAETNPRARYGFAGALAEFKDPKGVEQLQAICSDPKLPIAVNIESETYLQMAHLPIAACAETILNSLSIEADSPYRDSALYPLAGMYREAFPDQASRILAAIEALLKDPSQQPHVRLMASHTLAQIGAPTSAAALEAAITREQDPNMKASLQSDLNILQKKQ
jgi:HEAT repeat protein